MTGDQIVGILILISLVVCLYAVVCISLIGEKEVDPLNTNLYLSIILLPCILGILFWRGLKKLGNKIVNLKAVKAFHKFMMQKPSDLFKYKIVIERK